MNFLNQYPWPGVFQFGTFLRIARNEFRCIFTFGQKGLTISICCLSIRLFCYVLFVPIFFSKIVKFPCRQAVGMSSCILPLLAMRIFSLFWNVLFCLFRFILLRYLVVFFLSPVPSCLFYWCFLFFVPTCSSVPPLSYQFHL